MTGESTDTRRDEPTPAAGRDWRGALHRLGPLIAVCALGLGLRVWGVGSQPILEDEVLTAFSAEGYVDHGVLGPTEPFHPNLRNLILWASTRWLGTGVAGLRGPSIAMGVLSIPLLLLVVRRLTGRRDVALLAAFLLAVDPVHIAYSRQSLQEVHTAFFILLGVYAFVRSHDETRQLTHPVWLLAAGVAFGLSVASKHHGVFPLALCGGAGVLFAARRRDWPAVGLVAVSLAIVPATVYMLTYVPWLERGYGVGDWLSMQVDLAGEMITHAGYATSSAIDDRAWLWFVQPLTGASSFNMVDGQPVITIAVGNPLVWMLVLPASAYLLIRHRAARGVRFLSLLFWLSYLPLVITSRPIWILSSVAVIPFAFALVATAAGALGVLSRRAITGACVGITLAVTLALYPLATGQGWDYDYLRPYVERFNPHAQ